MPQAALLIPLPNQIIHSQDEPKKLIIDNNNNPFSNIVEDHRIFLEKFEQITQQILNHREHIDMEETNQWLKTVLAETVPNGKLFRGILAYRTYNHLSGAPSSKDAAAICGWCVEMLHAAHLVKTNITEDIQISRNGPAWQVKSEMGAGAFNDAVLLTGALFHVLMDSFGEQTWCPALMELFHEAQLFRAFGESLVKRTKVGEQMNYLNVGRYETIVKYQTSYFSFYFPVAAAMLAAGVEPSEVESLKEVLLRIGYIYQVTQDLRNMNKDIDNRRLSWFVFMAIQKSNRNQKRVLRVCFGQKNEPGSNLKIRKLYAELSLKEEAEWLIEDEKSEVVQFIENLSSSSHRAMLYSVLNLPVVSNRSL